MNFRFHKISVKLYLVKMEAKRQVNRNLSSVAYDTYKDFAENTSIHGLKYTVKKEITATEK